MSKAIREKKEGNPFMRGLDTAEPLNGKPKPEKKEATQPAEANPFMRGMDLKKKEIASQEPSVIAETPAIVSEDGTESIVPSPSVLPSEKKETKKERYLAVETATASDLLNNYKLQSADKAIQFAKNPLDIAKNARNLNDYMQSREGKVGKITSDIIEKGQFNKEDIDYLVKVAPAAAQQLITTILPDATPQDVFSRGTIDKFLEQGKLVVNKEMTKAKVAASKGLENRVNQTLSSIQINPAQLQNDQYATQVNDGISGQKNKELAELEKKFPEKALYSDMAGTHYKRENSGQYSIEKASLEKKYSEIQNQIGISKAFSYAKANPVLTPLEIGEQWLKYAQPDTYKLWVKGGKRGAINRDIAEVGVQALYGSGKPGTAELAKADEANLDNQYPDKIVSETYHRLGAELYKNQNWAFNASPSVKELDKAAQQLPEKNREIYNRFIREKERRNIGTDVPMSGLLNKVGEGIASTATETWKGLGDLVGARSDKQVAFEALNEGSDTDFQDVGTYAPAKARLTELNNKVKKKQKLSGEEISEKQDLETFTGVRSTAQEIIDGTGNLTGQVIFQALGTKGVGAAASAGAKGVGILKGTAPLAGLATEDAIATAAFDFGITKAAITDVSAAAVAFASSYDAAKRDAFRLMPDDADAGKRTLYATVVGGLNAGTERIFKDEKVLNAFNKEISPNIRTLVGKLSEGEISKEALSTELSKIIKNSAAFIGEMAKANTKEAFEELATSAGQSTATAILAPTKFNSQEAFDDAVSTFTTTFLHGGLVSAAAGVGSYRANHISIPTISKLGVDQKLTDDTKSFINAQVLSGNMTQDEANGKFRILNTAIKINTEVMPQVAAIAPDLPQKAKEKYSIQLLNEKMLSAQAEQSTDDVLKLELERKVKESEKIRKQILSKEIFVDDDYSVASEDQINAVSPKDGLTPEEVVIKYAKDEKLGIYTQMVNDDPKLAIDILRDVAQQIHGINDKGEALEGGSRKGALSFQFSTDIMEAAEEQFPTPESTLIINDKTNSNEIENSSQEIGQEVSKKETTDSSQEGNEGSLQQNVNQEGAVETSETGAAPIQENKEPDSRVSDLISASIEKYNSAAPKEKSALKNKVIENNKYLEDLISDVKGESGTFSNTKGEQVNTTQGLKEQLEAGKMFLKHIGTVNDTENITIKPKVRVSADQLEKAQPTTKNETEQLQQPVTEAATEVNEPIAATQEGGSTETVRTEIPATSEGQAPVSKTSTKASTASRIRALKSSPTQAEVSAAQSIIDSISTAEEKKVIEDELGENASRTLAQWLKGIPTEISEAVYKIFRKIQNSIYKAAVVAGLVTGSFFMSAEVQAAPVNDVITSVVNKNPSIIGEPTRKELIQKYGQELADRWTDYKILSIKLPDGKTYKDVFNEMEAEYGIPAEIIFASTAEEGFRAFVYDPSPTKTPGFPVSGFADFGLDNFADIFPTLVKEGLLPQSFSSQFVPFKAENEKDVSVNSANFKTPQDAIKAKSAYLAYINDEVVDYANSKNIKLSESAMDFFMLVGYNAGLGNAKKMLLDYSGAGALKGNKFLKERPTQGNDKVTLKETSWKEPYTNVMRRINPANAWRGEGFFDSQETIADAGKKIADKIRSFKSPTNIAQSNIFGIPVAIYDGALELIATLVEGGTKLADAINEGIKSIKSQGVDTLDEEGFRNSLAGVEDESEVQDTDEENADQPEPVEEKPSGIRKALVSNQLVADVNLDRISDKDMMALGRKIIETGEVKPEALVNRIVKERVGVLTPAEVVAMITYKADLDNSLRDALKDYNERIETGEDIGTLGVEISDLNDKISNFDVAAVITANQQSMAFRLRQYMLDRDYNVTTQIEKYKKNNNGYIPPEVEARFRELDRELKAIQEKLTKAEKKLSEKEAQQAVDNIKEDVDREKARLSLTEDEIQQKVKEGVQKEIDAIHSKLSKEKQSLANKAIKALEKFQNKLRGKSYADVTGIVAFIDSGITVIKNAIKAGVAVADAVEIGINHIKDALSKKGVTTWAKEDEFRQDALAGFEAEGVATKREKGVPTINDDGSVSIPNSMLRDLVERGITDIDELTDAVHQVVAKDLPAITKRQVRDYITEYGKTINPTADDIQQQVNTAKRVGRLLSEVEDLENKRKRSSNASTKAKPTDRERELKRKIKVLTDAMGLTPEEKKLASAKDRVRNKIKELEERIKNKDFAKRVKLDPVKDPELLKLEAEKQKIQEQFDTEQYKQELKNRTFWKKTEDFLLELTSGLVRGLVASFDVSAGFVQGLWRLFSNPVNSAKAFGTMFRHLVSEKGSKEYMTKLKTSPAYNLMIASKLAIDDKDGKQSAKEGLFISNWINLIYNLAAKVLTFGYKPATNFIKKINPYEASKRAFDGYVNSIRVQSFTQLATALTDRGYTYEADPTVFKKAADFVNTTTGRASLGAIENNSKWLNILLFAPRKVAAEAKLFTPYAFAYYAKMPAPVRKRALLNLAKFAPTFLMVNALLHAALNKDDEEEDNFWNTNSSDFLTHKIGNKRLSIAGGMKSMIVFQSRMWNGVFTDQYGNTTKLGERPGKQINTRFDLAVRFMAGKAAPLIGAGIKKLDEKKGVEVDDAEVLRDLTVPIWMQDIKELYKDSPAEIGALLTILSLFGAGIRTVEEKKTAISKQELKSPEFKFFTDMGAEIPEGKTDRVQIPDEATSTMKNLTDYGEEKVKKYEVRRKEILKNELRILKGNGFVYVDKYGRVSINNNDGTREKKDLSKLTKDQWEETMSIIGGKATKKTKEELFPKED
jgi:hypothetical protein